MTMITESSIGRSYSNVKLFNQIAGNLKGDMLQQIDNQLGYVFEELTETIDAFEARDAGELVKEVADLAVVVNGLLQKMEAAGFDMELAMRLVDQNNLSKFPAKGEPLQYATGFKATLNEEFQRFVIKDAEGKVRKPANYVKLDLANCAPANFFGND